MSDPPSDCKASKLSSVDFLIFAFGLLSILLFNLADFWFGYNLNTIWILYLFTFGGLVYLLTPFLGFGLLGMSFSRRASVRRRWMRFSFFVILGVCFVVSFFLLDLGLRGMQARLKRLIAPGELYALGMMMLDGDTAGETFVDPPESVRRFEDEEMIRVPEAILNMYRSTPNYVWIGPHPEQQRDWIMITWGGGLHSRSVRILREGATYPTMIDTNFREIHPGLYVEFK